MTADQAHKLREADVRDLYETDFYAWTRAQAALLRAGRLAEADIANIAEEIEGLGKSEKRELVSRLKVLLMHLLKWQFQPSRRGTSWRLSIQNMRNAITEHLDENPSLTAHLEAVIAMAYGHARHEAAIETGLDISVFPPACPWAYPDFMADDFWPA